VLLEGSRGALVLGAFRDWHSTCDLTWLGPGVLVSGLLVVNHVCGHRAGSAFALAEYGVTQISWTACHGEDNDPCV
jgi:hypothetical protein